jgi:hypothetical protein
MTRRRNVNSLLPSEFVEHQIRSRSSHYTRWDLYISYASTCLQVDLPEPSKGFC